MKRIKSLVKLTNVNAEKLSSKEKSEITGGHFCGCFYELCEGSSRSDNNDANEPGGLESPYPAGQAYYGYWL